YNAPLIDAAKALQKEQDDLKTQLAQLRARLDEIQRNASSQSGAAKELQTRLDELKASAGLTPQTGDGIIVQLDDARNVSVSSRRSTIRRSFTTSSSGVTCRASASA